MIEWIIFAYIVAFGTITSLEDYYTNKIRNRWVLLAMLFGFVLSIALFFQEGAGILIAYYLNAFFSLMFGFMLWYSGLWSAGDAKLLLAYAFIIPPGFYSLSGFGNFPAVSLIVNTFTPFLIFSIIFVLIKTKKSINLDFVKYYLKPRIIGSIVLFFFGFSWIVNIAFSFFGIPTNLFLVVFSLFALILLFGRLFKFRIMSVAIILSIFRLIFDWKTWFSLHYMGLFLLMLLLFLILRFYLLSISYYLFSKKVFVEHIKPGMILAEDIIKTDKGYKKRIVSYFSLIEALLKQTKEKSVLSNAADGLTKKDVLKIKELHSKGLIKDHTLNVFQTLPFAPFMFLGALMIFFMQTDIFMWLSLL